MAFVQVASGGYSPTFFEMVAAERLMPSLKAAVVYALSVYAQHRPHLQRLLDHEEDIFFLISILLDRHSLLQNNASFAESLYALHRVPHPAASSSSSTPQGMETSRVLTPNQRRSSLMLLTLVPYLRAKLDAWYRISSLQDVRARVPVNPSSTSSAPNESSSSSSSSINSRLAVQRRVFELCRRIYPLLSSAHEASRFLYQLFYLLDRSPYFSPELHLLGIVVARVTAQDAALTQRRREAQHAQRLQWARTGRGGPAMHAVREAWVKLSSAASTHTRSALVLAVFGYKLLEWWYTSAEQKLGSEEPPPPPPPPLGPSPSPQGIRLPQDPSTCPLCRRPRTNPAMIATSGYVFCYPCAFKFVEASGCCPVTRISARVEQIRRLYPGGT